MNLVLHTCFLLLIFSFLSFHLGLESVFFVASMVNDRYMTSVEQAKCSVCQCPRISLGVGTRVLQPCQHVVCRTCLTGKDYTNPLSSQFIPVYIKLSVIMTHVV